MRKWRYYVWCGITMFAYRCPSYWMDGKWWNEKSVTVENLPLRFTPVDITNDMN
jgi:hypothetical protein